MMPDQPGNELTVVVVHVLRTAEIEGIAFAESGMIAAATLGDIVKEAGQIKALGFQDPLHDAAGLGQFMGKSRQGESPQVADHRKSNGHRRCRRGTGRAASGRRCARTRVYKPENAVGIHAPKCPGDEVRLPEDLHEQALTNRVLPECLTDEADIGTHLADRAGAYSEGRLVLLEQQENFKQRRGLLPEHIRRCGLKVAVDNPEAFVDPADSPAAAAEKGFLEMLQEDFVQKAQFLDGEKITLHQLLDGQSCIAVPVAEFLCQLPLVVEQQAVLLAVGEEMQAGTKLPQKVAAANEGFQFLGRQEVVVSQLPDLADAEVSARNPAEHLQVAQAAGTFLDVGFEIVGRVVKARVAFVLLGEFRREKFPGRPDSLGRGLFPHGLQKVGIPDDQAALHNIGGNRDVFFRLLDAIPKTAQRVPDVEPDIPEESVQHLVEIPQGSRRRGPRQEHQVDIGMGVKFAAAVAADGHQRNRFVLVEPVGKLLPRQDQDAVDES